MYLAQTHYANNTTSKYSRFISWFYVDWGQTMVVLWIPMCYVKVSNLSFCVRQDSVHAQRLLKYINGNKCCEFDMKHRLLIDPPYSCDHSYYHKLSK